MLKRKKKKRKKIEEQQQNVEEKQLQLWPKTLMRKMNVISEKKKKHNCWLNICIVFRAFLKVESEPNNDAIKEKQTYK